MSYTTKCPVCNGAGKETCGCVTNGRPNKFCDRCGGRGSFTCKSCKGSGTVYVGSKP